MNTTRVQLRCPSILEEQRKNLTELTVDSLNSTAPGQVLPDPDYFFFGTDAANSPLGVLEEHQGFSPKEPIFAGPADESAAQVQMGAGMVMAMKHLDGI